MLVLRTSPCCSLHTVLSCILANPVLWAEALLGLPHRTPLWCLTCGLSLGPSALHTTLGCLHALLEKLWGAKKTEHPFHVFPYIKLYYIKLNLKGGKMGKRALTFPTHCLLLSLSDLSSAFTNLWTLKNILPPNDSKLLQNRGANEARPTQCFLHLSRRPSNEITSSTEPSFACGWPLPGDPAVILWVSRTHLARMLGVSSNSYPSPESEPLGVKHSLICTHWHHNLNRFLRSGTALVAAVSLSLHTHRCEMSRELQHLQPPTWTWAVSWLRGTAKSRGQPPVPSTQLYRQHGQPAGQRRAGMQMAEGRHQARAFLPVPLSQSALCFALPSVYLDFFVQQNRVT